MFSLSERCSVDDHRVSDSKVLIERMQIRFDGRAMSFECGRRARDSKGFQDSAPGLDFAVERYVLYWSQRDELMCMMCIACWEHVRF